MQPNSSEPDPSASPPEMHPDLSKEDPKKRIAVVAFFATLLHPLLWLSLMDGIGGFEGAVISLLILVEIVLLVGALINIVNQNLVMKRLSQGILLAFGFQLLLVGLCFAVVFSYL